MHRNVYAFTLNVLLILHYAVFAAEAKDESRAISVSLNGEMPYSTCRPLKSVGIDRQEVLLTLDNITLIMDGASSYTFTGTLDKDGKLFLMQGGKRQLVGLKTGWSFENDRRMKINPFADLAPSDMKAIRGIYLNDKVTRQAAELLSHLNHDKAFITITHNTAQKGGRFPELPSKTNFLSIQESSSDGIKDYGRLTSFDSLRYFSIDSFGAPDIDARLIKQNTRLAYLDLNMQTIKNTSVLGELRELRHLDLSNCKELQNIAFIGKLDKLEELKISRTAISDLSPMQDLKHIAIVDAHSSAVSRLPGKHVPNLRKLNVMATRLSKEAVETFEKANPQCKISFGWNAMLQAALKSADRLRVRSGGTCHRRTEEEKTLFEIIKTEDVKEVISNIRIDPLKSNFHCMCCGNPSLEFYKGGDLLVTLGFHHGKSLRWMDGPWPMDGMLTSDSSVFLCELLDKHGIQGPLAEQREERKRRQAAQRRFAIYKRLLPEGVKTHLSEAKTAEDATNAFILGEKNKGRRVALGLKIIGCDYGSWNQKNSFDPLIMALLDNKVPIDMSDMKDNKNIKQKDLISAQDIIEAVEKNKDDEMLARGAARWFLGEGKHKAIPKDKLETLLPLIARHGLTHPRQINRRRTLLALKKLNCTMGSKILNKVLAGDFKPLSLKPEEELEPGGSIVFWPGDGDVPDECSDQAYAALILAEQGNRKILSKVQALLMSEKNPKSKEIMEKALSLLENQK